MNAEDDYRSTATHFKTVSLAHHYATQCARVTGQRWFVCKRLQRWYAVSPSLTATVRANPSWPGRRLS